MSGYEPWSEVVCGILEHSGFKSPCAVAASSISGDGDTEEIEKLVELMSLQRDLRFHDLVELCRKYSLFVRLVGEDLRESRSSFAIRTFARRSATPMLAMSKPVKPRRRLAEL
jgi:hypothetical protein